MQDPAYQVIKSAAAAAAAVQFPEQEQLKCPRCESTNTKFCYYNNYNLSQPRHYCKNCRRYWTKGGALRNIPVGGGSRKSSSSSASSSSAAAANANANAANSSSSSSNKRSSAANATSNPKRSAPASTAGDLDPQLALHRQFGALSPQPPQPNPPPPVIHGSFSSLLASNSGQFGGGGFIEAMGQGGSGGHESGSDSGRVGDGYWVGGGNGWPDLAIYTPGTNFQ